MAEFIEVARAKRRMCKAHTEECDKCKLRGNCSLLNVCAYSDDDVKKLENEIMSWAAEHPEPVYPSWYEYLTDMYPATWNMIKDKLIPADIAEKLGIEPKEG